MTHVIKRQLRVPFRPKLSLNYAGLAINAAHNLNLLQLLWVVALIDTNSIDPKISRMFLVSQSAQRLSKIYTDL